jgi:hypothetical protein
MHSVQFDPNWYYPIKVAGRLIADAHATHTSTIEVRLRTIEKRGKSRASKNGKDPVNKNAENIFAAGQTLSSRAARPHASSIMTRLEGSRGEEPGETASLPTWSTSNRRLAWTYAWLAISLPSAACAAERRAIGTR